jgi:hypothetical protein
MLADDAWMDVGQNRWWPDNGSRPTYHFTEKVIQICQRREEDRLNCAARGLSIAPASFVDACSLLSRRRLLSQCFKIGVLAPMIGARIFRF